MLASQAAPEKNPQVQNKQIKHKTDPKSTDICKLAENKNTVFIYLNRTYNEMCAKNDRCSAVCVYQALSGLYT